MSSGGASPTYRAFSYAQFGIVADRFRGLLSRAGVKPGDLVCLIGKSNEDLIAAFWACIQLGVVTSIFPPPSPLQDKANYVSQQEKAIAIVDPVALVLTDEGAAELLEQANLPSALRILSLDTTDAPAESSVRVEGYDPERILFVQHSSGTTALKKGVAITELQLSLQLETYAAELCAGAPPLERFVIASWLPLYHDMGLVACLLLSMFVGAKLCVIDPFDWSAAPGALFDLIERERASHVWLPNFAFRHLYRCHPRGSTKDLSSVRRWIDCSEPCRPETLQEFGERFAPNGVKPEALACCYAMAETVFAISQTPNGEAPRQLQIESAEIRIGEPVRAGPAAGRSVLSNGPPLAGVDVAILVDGRFRGEGIVGEICVRAPFLFTGYFRRPELTDASFIDGFYRTGDIGFLHDGEVFITGRLKEIIIIHGKNYLAGDLEDVINRAAGVKPGRCVAFGLFSPQSGSEDLIVVAEHDPASGLDPQSIKIDIQNRLGSEFAISAGDILLVEERWLVKSTSGKVSRDANAKKYKAEMSASEI